MKNLNVLDFYVVSCYFNLNILHIWNLILQPVKWTVQSEQTEEDDEVQLQQQKLN